MIYVIGEKSVRKNRRLAATALRLSDPAGKSEIKMVLWGSEPDEEKYNVDELIFIRGEQIPSELYVYEELVQTLADLIRRDRPELVLLPSTMQHRELAARLSVAAECPLLTDCTQIQREKGKVLGMKPALDGTSFIQYSFGADRTGIVVLKGADEDDGRQGKACRLTVLEPVDADPERKIPVIEEVRHKENARGDIKDAEIIFAGGRGMLNADSFGLLRKLADCYGAFVGASRPVVDSGWAAVDEQIGQTGSFVRPQVYLAFGISGAVQHLAGMKDSKVIVAVNNNRRSPIFRYSDYGICADANSIIRNMLNILQVGTENK